ncbi:MAG: hypothetical protein H7831_17990, partial [Magnetococcus sp. WYHC-3]
MRKIGIVGNDITQSDLIERSKGFDLWSCNNLFAGFPDVTFDRWFELHDFKRREKQIARRASDYYPISSEITVREYMDQINALNIPVFMQRKWRAIKKSQVFPFDAIMAKWGKYFGCSFTWMMAMALDEGVDEIGIFGLNFGMQEYYYQRPSLEYMIGYARGTGVKVTIDEASCQLLKEPYVYAINEDYDLIYMLHG